MRILSAISLVSFFLFGANMSLARGSHSTGPHTAAAITQPVTAAITRVDTAVHTAVDTMRTQQQGIITGTTLNP
jgi:hypothetical protein